MTQTARNATRPGSVRLCEGGRVVIPAEVREQLGLKVGDRLVLRVEDGEIRLFTREQGIRKVQAWFAPYRKEGVSLSDELIAERRAEAARE
jgi:AbrB family looped-hinge helix DNA binding protein